MIRDRRGSPGRSQRLETRQRLVNAREPAYPVPDAAPPPGAARERRDAVDARDELLTRSRITEIEHLAAAAWPAAERRTLGPWTLRASEGVTSRANSVLPVPPSGAAPAGHVDGLIDEVERWYAERALPPTMQVSPAAWPDDLDARLARRGWIVDSPSEVWTALAAVVAKRCPDATPPPAIADRPDAAWLDFAYGDLPPARRTARAGIVGRIERQAAFASIVEGGRLVACGFAVADAGWAGIFSMRTDPERRGRGLGARILGVLARWAVARSAGRLYLQVDADNTPALGLYRKSGFGLAYAYHYRVAPRRATVAGNPPAGAMV